MIQKLKEKQSVGYMSDVAIKIENISKLYQLGTVSTQTLYGDLHRWWARLRGQEDPFQKIGTTNSLNSKDGEFVWALKDVNLEIKQGDIVGIIGRNGAGKSTLLKILSRVTAPTRGQITVNGRIASLLEVGTGFHPELTGRENVFLNGAIMGMTKAEIHSKFDEIVDFSGVEKYIDTPVKRYSSGMYVRLAFAVAAHLEPEILIVDEVLAVGDADFQKKCLGKMGDVAKNGRTVLFVSHNMLAISSLCAKGAVFNKGQVFFQGTASQAIDQYSGLIQNNIDQSLHTRTDCFTNQSLVCLKTWTESNGVCKDTFVSGETISIKLNCRMLSDVSSKSTMSVAFAINGNFSEQICDLWNVGAGYPFNNLTGELITVECILPKLPFNQGKYMYNICIKMGSEVVYMIGNAGYFHVEAGDFFNSGKLPEANQGNILIEQKWNVTKCVE